MADCLAADFDGVGFVGGVFVNNTLIYPNTQYANRSLLKNMGVEDPVKLLDEGRFIRIFRGI